MKLCTRHEGTKKCEIGSFHELSRCEIYYSLCDLVAEILLLKMISTN